MKKKQEVEPTTNTLYERRGNKYVPVAEYFTTDYWSNGNYLVQIKPGARSMTRLIFPKSEPEVEAALKAVGNGMLEAMRDKAHTPTNPKPEDFTPKQKKAVEMWKEAFGNNFVYFPSKQEIVDAGLDELRNMLKNTKPY